LSPATTSVTAVLAPRRAVPLDAPRRSPRRAARRAAPRRSPRRPEPELRGRAKELGVISWASTEEVNAAHLSRRDLSRRGSANPAP